MMSHYRPKFRIAERARMSSADPIVLVATNFYQNDELFRAELEGGAYVQPFDRKINRVDVRDIAEAGARACLDRSLASGAYPVFGPESLDGPDCAALWSKALGRPVCYDKSGFANAVERAELGDKKRADFLATYEVIQNFEMKTKAAEVARVTALLGRPPRSYADYVRERAAEWQSALGIALA